MLFLPPQPVTLMNLLKFIEYSPEVNRDSRLPSEDELVQAESPLNAVTTSAVPLFAKPTIMEVPMWFLSDLCVRNEWLL
jgi:hypothetical protein